MGEPAIASFLERLESGAVALDRVLPTYPNIELWNFLELARETAARRLQRDRYDPPAGGSTGAQP